LHKARKLPKRELPKEEFRRTVEKELTGKDTEPSVIMYFKLHKSEIRSDAVGEGRVCWAGSALLLANAMQRMRITRVTRRRGEDLGLIRTNAILTRHEGHFLPGAKRKNRCYRPGSEFLEPHAGYSLTRPTVMY